MAQQSFYVDINLQKNELLRAKLQPVSTTEREALASTLNSNDKGLIVYDKDVTFFYGWNGNEFKRVGLSDTELEMLYESFDRSVMDIAVTSNATDKTITLTYRDGSTIQDTFQYAYIHDQSIPATIWAVNHNLGKYPSVTITDTAGSEIIGEAEYLNANTLLLYFSAAFSGKAFLN